MKRIIILVLTVVVSCVSIAQTYKVSEARSNRRNVKKILKETSEYIYTLEVEQRDPKSGSSGMESSPHFLMKYDSNMKTVYEVPIDLGKYKPERQFKDIQQIGNDFYVVFITNNYKEKKKTLHRQKLNLDEGLLLDEINEITSLSYSEYGRFNHGIYITKESPNKTKFLVLEIPPLGEDSICFKIYNQDWTLNKKVSSIRHFGGSLSNKYPNYFYAYIAYPNYFISEFFSNFDEFIFNDNGDFAFSDSYEDKIDIYQCVNSNKIEIFTIQQDLMQDYKLIFSNQNVELYGVYSSFIEKEGKGMGFFFASSNEKYKIIKKERNIETLDKVHSKYTGGVTTYSILDLTIVDGKKYLIFNVNCAYKISVNNNVNAVDYRFNNICIAQFENLKFNSIEVIPKSTEEYRSWKHIGFNYYKRGNELNFFFLDNFSNKQSRINNNGIDVVEIKKPTILTEAKFNLKTNKVTYSYPFEGSYYNTLKLDTPYLINKKHISLEDVKSKQKYFIKRF